MGESILRTQILRLIDVRKKLKNGAYITLREENDVSSVLGVIKFKDKREMAGRIDGFFTWLGGVLEKKDRFLKTT